jgi:putative salt-induced outer membrane protein
LSLSKARTRLLFIICVTLIGPVFIGQTLCGAEMPGSDPLLLMITTAAAASGGKNLLPVLETAIEAAPDRRDELAEFARDLAPDRVAEINAALGLSETPTPQKAMAKNSVKSETDQSGFFRFSAWDGEVDLGGTLNTGNTPAKAFSGSVKLSNAIGLWRHKLAASFDYARNDGNVTKQRLLTSYQLNYETDSRAYAFGRTEYEDDRFSGFNYRIYGGGGFGYRLFNGDTVQWSAEAGPGLRYARVSDTGGDEAQFTFRTASSFKWLVFPSTVFAQDTEYLLNGSNTLNSTTSLTVALTDKLSGRMSFNLRNDSSPPPGAVSTDTTTKASIVYGF